MGQLVKDLPANVGDKRDVSSILGLGRFPGEGNSNPFQYFCLGNPMDRGPGGLQSTGVAKELEITEQPKNNNFSN